MREPSAPELLQIWERGRTLPPVQRALALMAAACPEASPETLARFSIGRRDGELLKLRERLFGPMVTGLVTCSNCGGDVEVTFDISEVLTNSALKPDPEVSLTVDGYELRCRLPNSEDLAIAAEQPDLASTRKLILQRCLLSAGCEGASTACAQLPPAIFEAVSERLAEADPLADIQLSVTCPACAQNCRPRFDIVSFLWSEIDAWARRLLYEVHTLAAAYGWAERDILGLSAFRRQCYLQMIGV